MPTVKSRRTKPAEEGTARRSGGGSDKVFEAVSVNILDVLRRIEGKPQTSERGRPDRKRRLRVDTDEDA